MNLKCRICLFKIESDNGTNIFTVTKNGQIISDILTNFASVEITQGDGLPSTLCVNCEQKVTMLIDFRIQIINSDTELRKRNCSNLVVDKAEWDSTDFTNHVEKIKVEDPFAEYKECPVDDSISLEGVSTYSCEVCKKRFGSEQLLIQHAEMHDEDRPFKCYECDKAFKKQTSFVSHCRLLHNETNYKCEVCNKIFEQYSLFKDHWKTHTAAKSRKIYEFAYERFIKWAREQNVHDYSENVLLTYFSHLSEKMKSSSLWAQYSMVKAELNTKHNVNIEKYTKLNAFLRRQGEGYKPKKSKVFTQKQFDDFLHNAPNNIYLAAKVILIFGVMGACRCDELLQISVNDIEDLGNLILVKIPTRKSKKSRSFTITGDFYINIYRKYATLRPKDTSFSRFFIKYRSGQCHRIVMGIHKLSNVPREVATYLKLPNPTEYTGHCLRRTSAILLVDDDEDITTLKRRGSWKPNSVAEDCIQESIRNKVQSAMEMLTPIDYNETPNTSIEMNWSTFSKFRNVETPQLNNEPSTGFMLQHSSKIKHNDTGTASNEFNVENYTTENYKTFKG